MLPNFPQTSTAHFHPPITIPRSSAPTCSCRKSVPWSRGHSLASLPEQAPRFLQLLRDCDGCDGARTGYASSRSDRLYLRHLRRQSAELGGTWLRCARLDADLLCWLWLDKL